MFAQPKGCLIPSLGPHLLHIVGHLLGQILEELLSDDVGTDLFRCLASEDSTVELPGSGLSLGQEVLLWIQREWVVMSHQPELSYSGFQEKI